MGGSSKEFVEAKALCKAAIRGAEGVQDKEDKVLASFKTWDKDGNGKISRSEFEAVLTTLNAALTPEKIDAMMTAMDKDKDGELNYEELTTYLFQAPFLQIFFKEAKKIMDGFVSKCLAAIEELFEKASDPMEAMMQMESKMQEFQAGFDAELKEKLEPILNKAIDWHDKDGSGVLERDESIIFFSNYAGFLAAHCKVMMNMAVGMGVKMMDPVLKKVVQAGEMSNEDAAQQKKQAKDAFTAMKAQFDEKLKDKEAEYRANVDDRHKAAFAVLDVNKDGRLQRGKIVQHLMPKNGKGKGKGKGDCEIDEFDKALGIHVGPSDLDCPMQ